MPGWLVRIALLAPGLLLLAVGAGFWAGAAWAPGLWPWPDGRLSHLFLASMLLAQGGTIVWVGWTLELQAVRGGLVGLAAAAIGIAAHMFGLQESAASSARWVWIGVGGSMAAGALVLLALSGRFPVRDRRPTPALVRWSFLVFSLALGVGTAMLLLRAPVVFPWPLEPDSSVVFGFLFLASAVYFFHGWLRPIVSNARGQLIGFLIYDLVLIPPYLQHWGKTAGDYRISLIVYLVVLFGSALLALWFFWRYPLRRAG